MTLIDWRDVRPGTVLTVKRLGRQNTFKLRVTKVSPLSLGKYADVQGVRLTMAGKPSRLRAGAGLPPGERVELVYLDDVKAMEWDLEGLHEAAREEYRSRRKLNKDGRRARGSSNANQRGGSATRRARKLWLLAQFGDGEKAPCAFQCGTIVGLETISVDRIIPGAQGGTYARGNIRPACRRCNSSHGATVRRS